MNEAIIKRKCHDIYIVSINNISSNIQAIVSYHHPDYRSETVYIDVEILIENMPQLLYDSLTSNRSNNLITEGKKLIEQTLIKFYQLNESSTFTFIETLEAYQNDYWQDNKNIETIHVRNYKNNMSTFHITKYSDGERKIFYTTKEVFDYIKVVEERFNN